MKHLCTLLIMALTCHIASAQKENPQAIAAMKKAIGSIIDGYTTYSYPTDNYGVGTVCSGKWVPKGSMVCDMIESYGLSKKGTDVEAWKTLNGMAFRGDGQQLVLEDSLNISYGVGLLLPKILQALSINISADVNKVRSVRLVIDSATLRYLKYGDFKRFAESGKNPDLKEAWDRKEVLVVTSDFVLLNYRLEINPSDSFGIALGAKLEQAINIAPNILTGDDSLGIRVARHGSGHFTLTSIHPVVFAVYINKQKKLQPQGAENDFKNWDIERSEMIGPDQYLTQ